MEAREKTIKQLFIGTCWSYLHDNFHKFTETNKIKVALTLAQKDIAQEVNSNVNVNKLPAVEINGAPINYNVGDQNDNGAGAS